MLDDKECKEMLLISAKMLQSLMMLCCKFVLSCSLQSPTERCFLLVLKTTEAPCALSRRRRRSRSCAIIINDEIQPES